MLSPTQARACSTCVFSQMCRHAHCSCVFEITMSERVAYLIKISRVKNSRLKCSSCTNTSAHINEYSHTTQRCDTIVIEACSCKNPRFIVRSFRLQLVPFQQHSRYRRSVRFFRHRVTVCLCVATGSIHPYRGSVKTNISLAF